MVVGGTGVNSHFSRVFLGERCFTDLENSDRLRLYIGGIMKKLIFTILSIFIELSNEAIKASDSDAKSTIEYSAYLARNQARVAEYFEPRGDKPKILIKGCWHGHDPKLVTTENKEGLKHNDALTMDEDASENGTKPVLSSLEKIDILADFTVGGCLQKILPDNSLDIVDYEQSMCHAFEDKCLLTADVTFPIVNGEKSVKVVVRPADHEADKNADAERFREDYRTLKPGGILRFDRVVALCEGPKIVYEATAYIKMNGYAVTRLVLDHAPYGNPLSIPLASELTNLADGLVFDCLTRAGFINPRIVDFNEECRKGLGIQVFEATKPLEAPL